MFVLLFIGWWYGAGWSWLARRIASKYRFIAEAFSVGILLRTFFAPWKQIQSTTTLQNFIQSSVDNLISRFIGVAVRSVMIFSALLLTILLTVFSIFSFVLWPILPLLIFILPILSVMKVGI